MTKNKKAPSLNSEKPLDAKPKFIPKSYPKAWEIELTDEQRDNLKKSIVEDEKKYKELGKKLAEDKAFFNPFKNK